MAKKWPSQFHHPQKWTIDLLFKIKESANSWQIFRTSLPTALFCRHHKCMFPFWFFKVSSVTCLNANDILNFMKIQSSYLLWNYQRNQASLYSNYISYFLNKFLVSLCQQSSYMFAIRDKILFLKCNWWKWKIKVEIKVDEEYIEGTTIFPFNFLFFTTFITYIDDLKLNSNNVIELHFAALSFFFSGI